MGIINHHMRWVYESSDDKTGRGVEGAYHDAQVGAGINVPAIVNAVIATASDIVIVQILMSYGTITVTKICEQ